ncbi:SPFH domain-containing protein [Entomomonas asaccharolytica]|uniref:Band 7 domain-containing protein n=1 Tax=Entomomonas asaccharolytica TaxID=2785331 RepID=A0A974NHH1_9GAMM|nr:SPFH domain-containing protein [Entomomonas asaccharolytica]QQP86680.1 hypothetical protein JHT90_05425 [Entomomonas asaccharolytica]
MTTLVLVILVSIVLFVVGIIVFFKLFYTQVPQNSALIVNNQKVYFSNAVTMPTDKKQLMEILPVQIKTTYLDSSGLFCKEKLLLDVIITYNLCVNFSTESVLKAAKTVGVADVANSSAVSKALTPIITSIVRKLVQQLPLEVLQKDQGKVRKAIIAQLTNQLDGYNLEYINIDKVELTSLDKLEQTNQKLYEQQQEARLEWDIEQKKILERRLKLIVEHQQDLSRKIKQMIDSYQAIIRKKIKFFLNRELLK